VRIATHWKQQAYCQSKKIELKKERENAVYQKVSKNDIEKLKKQYNYTRIFAAGPDANLNTNLLEMIEETLTACIM
jgi:uncharacterized protein YciI